MGFGNVATMIIMFIAVMLMATGAIVSIRAQIDKTQSSMQTQADFLNNQIKTNVQITQVNYSAGETTLYAINNGKTILQIAKVDVFLDAEFVPRNDTNRTIALEASTDITNPGLWDPDEVLKVIINKVINSGQHRVIMTTQYGTKDEELFST
jgi:archaellum component FlaF (FlaF/FlaG flagellin family)